MDDITASIIVACQTDGAAAAVDKLGFSFSMLARKAIDFGKGSISAFSDLQEETNKFNVVFQGTGIKSKKVVDELIAGYGASELSAKKMLAATGDLLTGLGVERDVSLELAEATAKLGSDLASFSNYAGGAEGAAMALTKGMLGERESMKMLGIVIREDDEAYKALQKQAMTTGVTIDALGKTFKVSSEQQAKAAATIALAYKQSPNAIGDFSRSMDSIANSGRILNNRFLDLKIAVGGFLNDLANVGSAKGEFAEFIGDITKFIKKNSDEWAYVIKSFALGIKLAIKQTAAIFKPLFTGISAGFQNIVTIGQWFNDNWSKIWNNGFEIVKAVFLDIWEYIKWFWGPDGMITGFFVTAGKAIWEALKVGIKGGDVGKVFTEAFQGYIDKNVVAGFAKQGKNIEAAMAKAGISAFPTLKGADWDIMGTWRKQYIEYEKDMQKLDLDYMKKKDARFQKESSPKLQQEAKKIQEVSGKSFGSFSAADLNQKIAGTMSPAVKTATNTEKMATNTGKTVDLLKSILSKIPAVKARGPRQSDIGIPGTTPESQRSNSLAAPELPAVKALVSGEWRLPLPELPAVKALQQGVVPQTQETAVPMTAAAQIGIGSEAKPVKDILEVVKDQRALLKKMVQQPPQLTITYS